MSAKDRQLTLNKKAINAPSWFAHNALELFKIPSEGDNTMLMGFYILNQINKIKGVSFHIDSANNILVQKGASDAFPCFVSHIDTVHKYDDGFNAYLTDKKGKKYIFAKDDKNRQVGTGGDDKCGVFICIQMIKILDNVKCAFFVGEESGGVGSSECKLSFFDDCAFIAGVDRWNGGDIVNNYGMDITISDDFDIFLQDAMLKHGYKYSSGLFTDAFNLFDRGVDVSCINISCGYYQHHSTGEFVDVNELYNCYLFCLNISHPDKIYNHLPEYDDNYCLECGKGIESNKLYCDYCRNSWANDYWNNEGNKEYCEYCGNEICTTNEKANRCCNVCFDLIVESMED